MEHKWLAGGLVNIFWFPPRKLGKLYDLTDIFQKGWNHHLDENNFIFFLFDYPQMPSTIDFSSA